ncbi:MAG: phytase [Parvularculaceae bacterium]|nr:phytase [Parvularculaceae bacterium]
MRLLFLCPFVVSIAACASTPFAPLPDVPAFAETAAVGSPNDAADDPAIWINQDNAAASLILGTDKQAGLYVYALDGSVRDFLPAGALNNFDLRQGVTIGAFSGDLAAASNRTDNTVTLFTIDGGKVAKSGAFPSAIVEPYGLCMGAVGGEVFVFVTYKTGDLVAYRLTGAGNGAEAARLKFGSQLEGCVYDENQRTLFVGEEGRGVWKTAFDGGSFASAVVVDTVGGASGIRADIEGMAIYKTGPEAGYLVVSSQGDDSYAVYDRAGDNKFVGRFRIGEGAASDGAQETDGLDVTATALGADLPAGVLVVQDGFNDPKGSKQNFKLVDWRALAAALNLQGTE